MPHEHNPFHGPWLCTESSGNPHFKVGDEFVLEEDMEQPEHVSLWWGEVRGAFILQEQSDEMKGSVWKESGEPRPQPATLLLVRGPVKSVAGDIQDGEHSSELTGTWMGTTRPHEHNPFHGLWLCIESSGNPHFKEHDEPVIREDMKKPEAATLQWGEVEGRFTLQVDKDTMEGTVWKKGGSVQPATLRLIQDQVWGEVRDGEQSSELTGTWKLKAQFSALRHRA